MEDKPEDRSGVKPEDQWQARRDGELLRRYVQAGSEQAFAELGRRYAGLVYATCLRETGDRTQAEDAAQDVFVLLARKASALQRSDTIAGWLYTAARYVCKNRMKQERRRRMNEAEAALSTVDADQDPGAAWKRIEPHLHDALDRLKAADREAVLLRFVAEQSFADVGGRLGLSENTARMRVNRAVEKIRAQLGKAGIAVSAGLLAALLAENIAQAAPTRLLATLPQIAHNGLSAGLASGLLANVSGPPVPRLAGRLAVSGWRPLLAAGALLALLIGFAAYRHTLPKTLSDAEQRRLFTSMAGRWQGTLEYADDRTLQHFTYPTTVTITPQNGANDLEYTAAYAGTPSVDVTTIRHDPTSGKIIAQNGGPQGSHGLYATGSLVQMQNGEAAFEGDSVAMNADVRLRIALKGNQLSIQEEYRKSGQARYQFRNRFTLSRR